MIKSMTVTNVMGASKTMRLTGYEESGFLIKEISGLGAGDVSIYTTELASVDGSIYNSSHLPERDIDITLLPVLTNDGTTIEERRLECYKYFPAKQKVTLTFETDTRIAQISGYVKKNEPEIFSSPETFSITVTCPNPYFFDVRYYRGETSKIFTGVEKQFEFPWQNEISDIQSVAGATYYSEQTAVSDAGVITVGMSGVTLKTNDTLLIQFKDAIPITNSNASNVLSLSFNGTTYNCYTESGGDLTFKDLITIDDHNLLLLKFIDSRFYYVEELNRDNSSVYRRIIFSEKYSQLEQVLVYKGDVPYGLTATVEIFGSISGLIIYNIDTRGFIKFDDEKIKAVTGAGLQARDVINFSTIDGDKYITLHRGVHSYSLLNCVNKNLEWFKMNVGDNLFSFTCSNTNACSFTMTYKTALLGI